MSGTPVMSGKTTPSGSSTAPPPVTRANRVLSGYLSPQVTMKSVPARTTAGLSYAVLVLAISIGVESSN